MMTVTVASPVTAVFPIDCTVSTANDAFATRVCPLYNLISLFAPGNDFARPSYDRCQIGVR